MIVFVVQRYGAYATDCELLQIFSSKNAAKDFIEEYLRYSDLQVYGTINEFEWYLSNNPNSEARLAIEEWQVQN
jgi:hypothetical protein